MKKVGICLSCRRKAYTNELHLCKRCNNEVGADFVKKLEEQRF